jgi:hypothetical protein
MFRRICQSLPYAALLVLMTGCIEQTQIITLNPDGRGKVEYDMKMPGESGLQINPSPAQKEKTPADLLEAAVARELTKKGHTAWKDVSAQWDADGRFHLKGTAYFDRLEDLWGAAQKKQPDIDFEHFELAIDKAKGFKLTLHKNESKKKPPVDFAKISDKELDDHVLMQRIKYQSSKAMLAGMLTDLRIKTEFRLPGEVGESKGFMKAGPRVAKRDFNGAALLKVMQKFMAQDDAALRKFLKDAKNPDALEAIGATEIVQDAYLIVPKLGPAQFDYDQEVKDARAAYPALRKQFNIAANAKLPGE